MSTVSLNRSGSARGLGALALLCAVLAAAVGGAFGYAYVRAFERGQAVAGAAAGRPDAVALAAARGDALLLGLGVSGLSLAILVCVLLRGWRRVQEAAEMSARAGLSDARQRFLHAVEGLPDGIAMWDAEGRFVLCNAVFRRQFGAAADQLEPGGRFEDYVRRSLELDDGAAPASQDERMAERMRRHRAGGCTFEVRRDGGWLLVREVRTPDGGTVVTATDISALMAREADLHAARAAAEAANRAKSEFLANMSHELRTPLNAVIGFSELMKSGALGPVGNPKYLEYSADIHASGRHLLAIINDILDLAKIEAGRLSLEDGLFDVDAVVGEALRTVIPQATAAGVALAAAAPSGIAGLRGDARAFRQILLNLLSNAVKFTPRGGVVSVLMRTAPDGAFELAVADTGIGIAPEHLDLVLQPFGQVRGALNRPTGGTGLGLPIAKSLIEQIGGSLQLRSTLGQGTTVTLRLPAGHVVRAADAGQDWPPSHAAGGRRRAAANGD